MRAFLLPALLALTTAMSARPPSDVLERLQAFVQAGPGGASLVWVDTDGPAMFAAGTLSAQDPRPVTADTRFETGSVSKVFTSLLLAEAERQGKASRLDPAARHLLPPDDSAHPALAKITLLSLSTHTSGLPRLPGNLGPNPDGNPDPYATYDRAALLAALRQHGPAAPAGLTVAYSNFGVAVLGEALAAAWGLPYAEAATRHLLRPLGLDATTAGLAGQARPAEVAPGHGLKGVVPTWTWLAFAPAGGWRSSAGDLGRFLAACLDPAHPLQPAVTATLRPQRPVEDTGGHIGLGWFLTDDTDRAIAWHNGATAGTRAFLALDRAGRRGLAVLTNVPRAPEPLGWGLLGTKPPRPAPMTVPDAAGFVGRYPLGPGFALDITETDGGLAVQGTAQPRSRLRPSGADRFAVVGVPAEIGFERDASGSVTALVLHQNAREQRAPRQPLPLPPPEYAVAPDRLRDYVGRYALAPTFTLAITLEGGRLFAQATGQPRLPVFASAPDEFAYRAVEARLRFRRETGGRVASVVLLQNGRELPGARIEE